MSLFARIFSEPELQAAPPVLVDVGAAGGMHAAWRKIARYSIGFGFEPDARESAPLRSAQPRFKEWKFAPTVAWPHETKSGQVPFHLTRSPQCSSGLLPDQAGLAAWAFADQFTVERICSMPASTIHSALIAHGIDRIDWLKCDTQGLDLALYRSLPSEIRRGVLAVEFEPGLIDAYVGEDKLGAVLSAMSEEPYWLAKCTINGTPRGSADVLGESIGRGSISWLRRFGPTAPGWANVCWLRNMAGPETAVARRSQLLAWVFATLCDQPAEALLIAKLGNERYPSDLFADMMRASRRRLCYATWQRLPGVLLRRIGLSYR